MGQMPVKWKKRPPAMRAMAATRNLRIGILGAESSDQRPAAKPNIMVPSVGMKLSVR
jgi:hypothetical protein